MKKIILSIALILPCILSYAEEPVKAILPDNTVLFAHRDSCDLYMDIYQPAPGSDSQGKPTVMFVFGGGFMCGQRDDPGYLPWFKEMTEKGYRMVSIDYRLGLKGVKKVGLAQAKIIFKAVSMAVEDAFSATLWLCEHSAEYGIDPENIVISGSSAGAITSLQCEYEICNSSNLASVLPDGFNYAGVMSFSGGIANMGRPFNFEKAPCPILFLHGTADKIVAYNMMGLGSTGLFGPVQIINRFKVLKNDKYWIVRFKGNTHEIALSMPNTVDIQDSFLTRCIRDKKTFKMDMTIDDPTIEHLQLTNLDDLYGN